MQDIPIAIKNPLYSTHKSNVKNRKAIRALVICLRRTNQIVYLSSGDAPSSSTGIMLIKDTFAP